MLLFFDDNDNDQWKLILVSILNLEDVMNKKYTFELWVSPALGVPTLDHTFIRCPEENKYFYCFDFTQMDENTSGARRILTATPNPNAYWRANSYRIPRMGLPDTAGLGIYGINGVCHQAANCFLHAIEETTGMKVQLPFGSKGSNREVSGYVMSYLIYGPYGTEPGLPDNKEQLWENHYNKWVDSLYRPALENYPVVKASAEGPDVMVNQTSENQESPNDGLSAVSQPLDMDEPLMEKCLSRIGKGGERLFFRLKGLVDITVKNVKQYFQEGNLNEFMGYYEKVISDINTVVNAQSDKAADHLRINLPTWKAAEQFVCDLNGRIVSFQDDLKRAMGNTEFADFTGHEDSIEIINKAIALKQWDTLKNP